MPEKDPTFRSTIQQLPAVGELKGSLAPAAPVDVEPIFDGDKKPAIRSTLGGVATTGSEFAPSLETDPLAGGTEGSPDALTPKSAFGKMAGPKTPDVDLTPGMAYRNADSGVKYSVDSVVAGDAGDLVRLTGSDGSKVTIPTENLGKAVWEKQ